MTNYYLSEIMWVKYDKRCIKNPLEGACLSGGKINWLVVW